MKKEEALNAELLKSAGSKVTPQRLALLSVLRKARKPLSVERIMAGLQGRMDRVTVYRALEALQKAGITRRVDMGHTHAHYELEGTEHHHHLICKKCGRIEDVLQCPVGDLERRVLRSSTHFKKIEGHALEFFGLCTSCSV